MSKVTFNKANKLLWVMMIILMPLALISVGCSNRPPRWSHDYWSNASIDHIVFITIDGQSLRIAESLDGGEFYETKAFFVGSSNGVLEFRNEDPLDDEITFIRIRRLRSDAIEVDAKNIEGLYYRVISTSY